MAGDGLKLVPLLLDDEILRLLDLFFEEVFFTGVRDLSLEDDRFLLVRLLIGDLDRLLVDHDLDLDLDKLLLLLRETDLPFLLPRPFFF